MNRSEFTGPVTGAIGVSGMLAFTARAAPSCGALRLSTRRLATFQLKLGI